MQPQQPQRALVPQILTIALAGSTLMYLYITMQSIKAHPADATYPPSLSNPMAPIFGVVSLAIIVAALIVPPLIAKSMIKTKPQPTDQDYFGAVFQALIVRLALFEAISILGLVVGMGSSDMNYSYIATGITLAGFALLFPSEDRLTTQTTDLKSGR